MKKYIYPANTAHFKKLIPFAQKILKILKENRIEAVIYGSFAHFHHTQDTKMKVNDIDILIRGNKFDKVVEVLKKRRIPNKYYPEWPTMIISRGRLKVEVDNLGKGYKNLKHNSLPNQVDKIDFYGLKVNLLRLDNLIDMYPVAYKRSNDNKVKILKKIRHLEKFLGRKII